MNKRGLALIKEFEGCRLMAYRCPAGIWTIGYGHTGPDVKAGVAISPQQADDWLHEDVSQFVAGVSKAVGSEAMANTTDNQFSAMVCLAYNIGLGAFRASSVLRLHKEGKPAEAVDRFRLWNKAGGKTLPGLTRRRAAEAALYAGA